MSIGEIHTFTNYFTVALVMLGIIFELIGRRNKNESAISYGWSCLRLGLIFALISLFTGFAAEKADATPSEAAIAAMFHKTISIVFTVFLVVLVAFRMLFNKKISSTEDGAFVRGIYMTLQVASLLLILVTLFLGVRMVRTYGVGVAPVQKLNQLPPTPPPPPASGIKVDTTQYLQ
ncbi:MAG TPA: DUF2231 domain-containing protein [Candidatus Kapabacteria bacterium]|nr:DUF2231 domain-containing protein [Candidatus Kapabacteria bacterium]